MPRISRRALFFRMHLRPFIFAQGVTTSRRENLLKRFSGTSRISSPRSELFLKDQLHFNADGYKLLAERVRLDLERYVKTK